MFIKWKFWPWRRKCKGDPSQNKMAVRPSNPKMENRSRGTWAMLCWPTRVEGNCSRLVAIGLSWSNSISKITIRSFKLLKNNMEKHMFQKWEVIIQKWILLLKINICKVMLSEWCRNQHLASTKNLKDKKIQNVDGFQKNDQKSWK